VFTTKYRKPVLVGEIGHTLRDLIREICRSEDIEILQGHIRPDHVHLLVSAPPQLGASLQSTSVDPESLAIRRGSLNLS
jgi:putative transposase